VSKVGRPLLNVPHFGGPEDIDPLVIVLLMVSALVTIKIQYSYADFLDLSWQHHPGQMILTSPEEIPWKHQ
jgi:hypothetical protein